MKKGFTSNVIARHKVARQSRSGFTLMELLVYMAIVGIIVVVAGQAFSNSTKFRVRTQNMLKAAQVAENVGTYFKSDVAQLGAKSSKEVSGASATSDNFYVSEDSKIYMHPADVDDPTNVDSSSYEVTHNKDNHQGFDEFKFRRVRYNSNGSYNAVEEITWSVTNKVLSRSCRTLDEGKGKDECPTNSPYTVEIADHVERFVVTPATPNTAVNAVLILPSTNESEKTFRLIPRFGEENFSFLTVTPSGLATSVNLKGFAPNYDFSANAPKLDQKKANQVFLTRNTTDGAWNEQCKQVSLEPDVEYEISFSMPYSEDASRMFVPGRDHMSVGFRYAADGNKPASLDDFLFFPPTINGASTGERSMRFTVPDAIENVCLAFTFASYSPVVANGTINIKDVALKKIPSANYRFQKNEVIPIGDKKNVKAMLLNLTIEVGGETGVDSLIIPVPSNGPRD